MAIHATRKSHRNPVTSDRRENRAAKARAHARDDKRQNTRAARAYAYKSTGDAR